MKTLSMKLFNKTAGGKCLYNAISILLFGDDIYCLKLIKDALAIIFKYEPLNEAYTFKYNRNPSNQYCHFNLNYE